MPRGELEACLDMGHRRRLRLQQVNLLKRPRRLRLPRSGPPARRSPSKCLTTTSHSDGRRPVEELDAVAAEACSSSRGRHGGTRQRLRRRSIWRDRTAANSGQEASYPRAARVTEDTSRE